MVRLPLLYLIFWLAGFATLVGGHRAAAVEGTLLGQDDLQKVFVELSGHHVGQEIEVSQFAALPPELAVPPGAVDFRIVSQGAVKGSGQRTMVVEVMVDGMAQGQIKMSGALTSYGTVVCAAHALSRRHLITADDLTRVRRDLTMLGPDLITDEAEVIGRELKTTLQPGAVLYGRFLKEPELVKRGDIVSILAANDYLSITVPGRVQDAGAKGDLIKVRNLMSRREIYAKIIGPGLVQTEF